MTGKAATRLAPPGAGVPRWQKLAGKYLLLPYWSVRLTWDGACALLCREGGELLALGTGVADELQTRRVLVPPQIGLEDSSRDWSFVMVLEHLVIVGERTAALLAALTRDRVPTTTFDTADLKPAGTVDAVAARESFRSFLCDFPRRAGAEIGERASSARYPHPWFGPLTAREWLCFLPFHQRIHVRQAQRILAALERSEPRPTR